MRATIREMKSYLFIYFKHCLSHKLNLFAKSVYIPINLFILGFVWMVLYQNNPSIPIQYVLSYYFLNFMITALFPFARLARDIQEEVFTGKLSAYLTRPISYFIPKVSLVISWSLTYIIFMSPFFIAFLFINQIYSADRIILFLFFLLGGQVMNFLIWMCIGLMSFWTSKNIGLVKINYTLSSLMSANLIPFALIPSEIQNIMNFMPYKFIVYYPIHVLIGERSNEVLINIVMLIVWICLLLLIASKIFKRGSYKYEGNQH